MDDRYRLLDVQGEGSFGVVYRAFDRMQMCDVAVKFLKHLNSDDRAQLEHEALLLAQLNHRYIVDLLDSDLDGMEPYLVIEYCDRGSLRNLVGRLHWSTAAHILSQVARGLQQIHESGGFHRDIKPENLLMKSENDDAFVVKIADFGIARVPGIGSVMTHGPRGTRGYIAREVLEGKPFTAAADIYSLGVVATELLTGAREPLGLQTANLPAELCDVVFAMRNPKPECRPTLREVAGFLQNQGQA